MHHLRPRNAVLCGAVIGLIAGAAVYGAASSASAPTPTALTPASASTAMAQVRAPCGAAQKLEHGACIVHVVPAVVVPAAGNPSKSGGGASVSSAHPKEPAEDEGAGQTEHGERG